MFLLRFVSVQTELFTMSVQKLFPVSEAKFVIIAIDGGRGKGSAFPFFALLYPCAVRSISVFWIAGILCKQLAWYIGAFSAVYNPLVLTAYRYGTFSVERVSVCFNAASAAAAFLVLAARAVKSAAGVNCFFHNCYLR